MRKDRLPALAALATIKKDADLARLAAISARLVTAQRTRDEMEAALASQTETVKASPELPLWQALETHVIFAEQALSNLAARIEEIAAEREASRKDCAGSFGRATVLDKLSARQKSQTRRAGS